jgi:sugar lactone lactonase YvrE
MMMSCVFLLALAGPSAASAATQSAPLNPLEVREYAKEFALPAVVAESHLLRQREGSALTEELKQAMGNRYAGLWFDNEVGRFVVPVPRAGGQPAATETLVSTGLSSSAYQTKEVSSTWLALERTQKDLTVALSPQTRTGEVETAIDPRTNAVILRLAEGVDSSEETDLSELAERQPVNVELRTYPVQRFQVHTTSCKTTSPRDCDAPLRGGVDLGSFLIEHRGNGETYEATATGVCSAGFKAIGNTYGNRFVLTAGHCPALHPGLTGWFSETASGVRHDVGAVEEYTFGPTGDWAKINANGSWWDTSPWPSEVAHYSENQSYPINYEAWSFPGEYVCLSGAKSGTTCGNVLETHVEGLHVEEGGGVYLPPEDEIIGICSIGGDSGGSVFSFSSNTALGLLSAGEGSPGEGANCRSYYTEITEATTAMGVSVGARIGGPPLASTGGVSVTGTVVTANGTVYPNAVPTKYFFEYGPTTAYGLAAPNPRGDAGHGTGGVGVSAPLTGLEPVSLYHMRLVAVSPAGVNYGSDFEFESGPGAPLVVTGGVVEREVHGAVLSGSVDPRHADTHYAFEIGPTTAYGTSFPVPAADAGAGKTFVPVIQQVTGLRPEIAYHYRLSASNSVGTTYGADHQFTTLANTPTIFSSFGSAGTGNAQFTNPLGVATDAAGNVYVVDEGGDRVEKLNLKGEYVGQFGSAGSGNGQFNAPEGIAIAPNGHILVTDTGNHRVEEFSSQGIFIQQMGSGEGGACGTALSSPAGVAAAAGGTIWVTDPGREKLYKFSETLNGGNCHYRAAYSGKCGGCTYKSPGGLAIDPSGDLWVLDSGSGRIEEQDPAGELVTWFAHLGSGEGQFSEPTGIAAMPTGNLMIVDRGNSRVQEISPTGEFLAQFGAKGTGSGQFTRPSAVALGKGGAIYVSDSGDNRLERWSQVHMPEVTTEAAGAVTPAGATLTGTLDPTGSATTWYFEYGPGGGYGSKAPASGEAAGKGIEPVAVSKSITGLKPGTNYHFRLVAENAEGKTQGTDQSFTTSGALPAVTTEPAGSVTSTGATLNGLVDPNELETTYYFEYGLGGGYGSKAPVPAAVAGKGTAPVAVTTSITGLKSGTTYQFRLVAENALGKSQGASRSFTTPGALPAVTTEPAGSVTSTGATLKGLVNPDGLETTYWFEYGKGGGYGSKAPVPAASAGNGSESVAVARSITGLSPATKYHFRLVAENSLGRTNGADQSFTTS